ncbi:Serine/threonine-protein kinase PknD [Streptomyces aurantiogriseus]
MRGATVAGRYRLVNIIGKGGIGEVWHAEDIQRGHDVALKIITVPETGTVHEASFRRETGVATRLAHPHVVSVHDHRCADLDGQRVRYLVMDLVAGRPLSAVTAVGPAAVADTVTWAHHVCQALLAAHRAGVVHRDIKPSNVLITHDGRALLCDFGIARLSDATGHTLTVTGNAIGTPAYMSPEQARGDTSLDSPSDLYSLGCLIHELLTGAPPFSGNAWQILHQHLRDTPAPLRSLRPDIPSELEQLVCQLTDMADQPVRAVADHAGSHRGRDAVPPLPSGSAAHRPHQRPADQHRHPVHRARARPRRGSRLPAGARGAVVDSCYHRSTGRSPSADLLRRRTPSGSAPAAPYGLGSGSRLHSRCTPCRRTAARCPRPGHVHYGDAGRQRRILAGRSPPHRRPDIPARLRHRAEQRRGHCPGACSRCHPQARPLTPNLAWLRRQEASGCSATSADASAATHRNPVILAALSWPPRHSDALPSWGVAPPRVAGRATARQTLRSKAYIPKCERPSETNRPRHGPCRGRDVARLRAEAGRAVSALPGAHCPVRAARPVDLPRLPRTREGGKPYGNLVAADASGRPLTLRRGRRGLDVGRGASCPASILSGRRHAQPSCPAARTV